MVQSRTRTGRQAGVFALVLSAMALLLAGLGSRAAQADHMTVTAVEGSAYGCFASVSLFGGPPNVRPPTPAVDLPAGGSAVPITGTAPTCNIVFGPATIFSAGPTNVSTQGTTGPNGSVTSTATLAPINTSQSEVFTATSLSSTCTANESGATGSTTVTGGVIVLRDPNPDTTGEAGEDIRTIPLNPAPNTTYEGTVANVNDNFRAVFNEQIVNPDGSLTVNAYHLYLLGPTAVGEVIVGQVVCGVTTQLAPTTTSSSTTSTTQPTTTSSSTTSTTQPTTTSSSTTSTTRPTTTSSSTTSTTMATTTSSSTTSTTMATTTSSMATTTTVGGQCVPGQGNDRPGYGYGDKNHRHCGPPGLDGNGNGNGKGKGGGGAMNSRPVTSTRPLPTPWLLGGLGVLFLISLVIPFRRMRSDQRTKG